MVEEKLNLTCPKCGETVEVFWIQGKAHSYMVPGTRAGSELKVSKTSDQIDGQCSCGYKFKPKDLEEEC